ncbi:MAG: DUF922 domain-containing protein [Halieaceae bacterium]|jgi:predicted secreted Zn-dependent protease|nr:DUF922 domain-containing protein [Halieaceae bacterium]
MWLWAKVAAVLGFSVLLMGSKIIIHVPAGGSVVSSSGLFACAAREVCTIEADERYFAETFTAEAAPGYTFDGWGDKAGALCAGSPDPYCSELDEAPLAGFGDGAPRLQRGSVLTLHPAFAARDEEADHSSARIDVSSFHRTRYYQVSGNTQEEIWSQLHGAANPLAPDRRSGVKPLGQASFQYRYDYRSAFAESAASCRLESASLTLRFDTVLPRLAATQPTSELLRDRWQPLQELVTEHEAGHHAIYRQLVTQLPEVLSGLGAVPCTELDEQVRLAVADTVAAIRRASAEYDEHGDGEAYLASSR